MIIFKTTQENMNLILEGKKKIELRKLDNKALQIIEMFANINNPKINACLNPRVIFITIETGEQYKVDITNFEVFKNELQSNLDFWELKLGNIFLEVWFCKIKTWLEEYYQNESHIVIYDLGKVEKI